MFIHDLSFVSPSALLFFGKTRASDVVPLVDQWIPIHVDRATSESISELKEKFNSLLARKAAKKNALSENEEQLIQMIVQLISKEERLVPERETMEENWDAE